MLYLHQFFKLLHNKHIWPNYSLWLETQWVGCGTYKPRLGGLLEPRGRWGNWKPACTDRLSILSLTSGMTPAGISTVPNGHPSATWSCIPQFVHTPVAPSSSFKTSRRLWRTRIFLEFLFSFESGGWKTPFDDWHNFRSQQAARPWGI